MFYPDVHVLNGGFVLADSQTWFGNALMPVDGIHFDAVGVPPYLAGQSILLQGFVALGEFRQRPLCSGPTGWKSSFD